MDCQEIFEGLSDYVDDELAEETCREINRHLKDCYNCRVVVNTLKRTISLYHTFPKQEMPDDVRDRLHATIRLVKEER
ncbi:MAG: anti-sigma factor family protein [Thermoleophilia bacterium]